MYPDDEAKNTECRHSQCDTMPVVLICLVFNNKAEAGTELGNKTHSSLMNDQVMSRQSVSCECKAFSDGFKFQRQTFIFPENEVVSIFQTVSNNLLIATKC